MISDSKDCNCYVAGPCENEMHSSEHKIAYCTLHGAAHDMLTGYKDILNMLAVSPLSDDALAGICRTFIKRAE